MPIIFFLFFISFSNAEVVENYSFKSQQLQSRYQQLINEIRCPVCQGQSISGSNASLAQDLRKVVYNMLKNKKSNDEIFGFMRDRYGDFIVFKPPMNEQTYLLWFAPPFFVILAIFFLIKRKKTVINNQNNANLTKAKELLND